MFNPQEHLTIIDGAAYLEVKWRLAWLRETYPNAVIETDMVESSRDHAIFKALVRLEGGASATGWGSEYRETFPNFVEAAETKALGRALAALGFGTQFANELETDGGRTEKSDAPVRLSAVEETQPRNYGNDIAVPSERQRDLIDALQRQLSISDQNLGILALKHGGKIVAELDRKGASALITELQRLKVNQADRKKTG